MAALKGAEPDSKPVTIIKPAMSLGYKIWIIVFCTVVKFWLYYLVIYLIWLVVDFNCYFFNVAFSFYFFILIKQHESFSLFSGMCSFH